MQDHQQQLQQQNNKIFLRTNKIPQIKNGKKQSTNKEPVYYNVNPSYISSDGNGGLVSTNVGPQFLLNGHNSKNITNFSSSTIDSNNPDIIYESASNKNLISTTSPIKSSNAKNGVLTINNALINPILPPGQIVANSNKNNNASSLNNKGGNLNVPNEKSFESDVAVNNAKRLTQGIAAIAAQRKAQQHHQVLMQELGHTNNNNVENQSELFTASRMTRNDEFDDYFEKKITDSNPQNTKVKKQVKIKDIVEFKLHEEDFNNDPFSMVFNNFLKQKLKF